MAKLTNAQVNALAQEVYEKLAELHKKNEKVIDKNKEFEKIFKEQYPEDYLFFKKYQKLLKNKPQNNVFNLGRVSLPNLIDYRINDRIWIIINKKYPLRSFTQPTEIKNKILIMTIESTDITVESIMKQFK